MGFFSQDKKTTTNVDARKSATDNAIQDSVVGSIVASGGANITTADPTVLKAALEAYGQQNESFQRTLRDLVSQQSEGTAEQTGALKDLVAGQLAQNTQFFEGFTKKLSDLTENVQTGGDSARNKIVLYVTLAAMAVLALMLWRR